MPHHRITRWILMFLPGIVASTRTHAQLLVRLGMGINANSAESGNRFRSGGCESNRVLVANVAGDGLADVVHLAKGGRKERNASGAIGNQLQGPFGLSRLLVPQQS